MIFSGLCDIVSAYYLDPGSIVIRHDRERRGIVKRTVPVWVTIALIVASIACMAFGIYRGELDTILMKAINICMECIGLG